MVRAKQAHLDKTHASVKSHVSHHQSTFAEGCPQQWDDQRAATGGRPWLTALVPLGSGESLGEARETYRRNDAGRDAPSQRTEGDGAALRPTGTDEGHCEGGGGSRDVPSPTGTEDSTYRGAARTPRGALAAAERPHCAAVQGCFRKKAPDLIPRKWETPVNECTVALFDAIYNFMTDMSRLHALQASALSGELRTRFC